MAYTQEVPNISMDIGIFYGLGVALVFVGFVIVLAAMLLLFFLGTKKEGKVKGGGAITIGPFPIVFGTDKESVKTVLTLSIVLLLLFIIMMAIFYFTHK